MEPSPYKEPKYSVLSCPRTTPILPTTTALVSRHSPVITPLLSRTQPGNMIVRVAAMSENYVVFIEQPIKMDLLKIVTCKLRGKAMSQGIYWDPKQETVFHLVDKHTGMVRCGYV